MDPITIAIIGLIAARVVGLGATDIAYAVRGKDSPRWEARKAAIKASAQTGRPVRYGFGGYMADMIDDAWISARERRERKHTGPAPHKNKPMRSYLGRVWGHRWEDAGLKHDKKHRDRQIKRGLVDPDTPVEGSVDDAFATVPRDQAANHFNTEGDPRASAGDPFTPDDLRRYGEWVKQRLAPRHHAAVDEWVTAESQAARDRSSFFDHRFTELADVDNSLNSWLNGTHPVVVQRQRSQDLIDQAMDLVDTTAKEPTQEEPIANSDTAMDHGDVDDLRTNPNPDPDGADMFKHPLDQRPDAFMAWVRQTYPDSWQQRLELTPELTKSEWDHHILDKEATTTDTPSAESSTPMEPTTPSTVTYLHEFINRKDPNTMTTTANAEAVGLDDAITYAEQSTQHHTDTASALELFKISLAQGGCGQGTLGIVDEIDDANTVIQGLYQRLHDSLVQDKVTVGDAYNARPDAGTKEFVTN